MRNEVFSYPVNDGAWAEGTPVLCAGVQKFAGMQPHADALSCSAPTYECLCRHLF